MEKILSYIPGFRSRDKKKMMAASVYYIAALASVLYSPTVMLILLALPFLFFGLVDLFSYKKKGMTFKEAFRNMVLAITVIIIAFMIQPAIDPADFSATQPPQEEEQPAADPAPSEPVAPTETTEVPGNFNDINDHTKLLLTSPEDHPREFLLVLEAISKAWENLELEDAMFDRLQESDYAMETINDLLRLRQQSYDIPAEVNMAINRLIAFDSSYEQTIRRYFEGNDFFAITREFRDEQWYFVLQSTAGQDSSADLFTRSLD